MGLAGFNRARRYRAVAGLRNKASLSRLGRMTKKQICAFARKQFGVALPVTFKKSELIAAVEQLAADHNRKDLQ
jgi:hypothetical protein